jgi:hypothetical protein
MTDIVCTLTDDDARARFAEYDRLLAAAYIGRERIGGGMRWALRPRVVDWARDLAAREQACCAFLTVSVEEVDDRVLWEMTADPAAQAVVDWFYDLPVIGANGTPCMIEPA